MDELEKLKEEVYKANIALIEVGLVILTWGNASAITKDRRYIIIKPSGISYDKMRPEDMVILDIEGNVVEGDLRPSSDTPTHLELYRNFPEVNSIIHTHSTHATSFAQAENPIRAIGTTHADYFYGDVPVSRRLTVEETEKDYELNTGRVIVETFRNTNPLKIPCCLVASHGVFVWGRDCKEAVHNAIVIEEIAKMNIFSFLINQKTAGISQHILDKHYYRKHGKKAYYGQI
jgi:L-ribulose-5-phosphate 4-epimerase